MPFTIPQILAALGIDDAAVTIVAGQYAIIRREPEPDESGISRSADIAFYLVDLDGDPAGGPHVIPDFGLVVEGLGVFEVLSEVPTSYDPFTGSVTASTASDPFVYWEIVLEQLPAFDPVFTSEQEVHVGFYWGGIPIAEGWGAGPFGHFPWPNYQGGGPLPPGDFEWSFIIEDVEPPSLVSAEAIDQFTVRLTFDDGMATSGDGSVLDPALWSLTRHNIDPLPGVSLAAVQLAQYTPITTIAVPTRWTYTDSTERLAANTSNFDEYDVGFLAFQESDSTYWMLTGIGIRPGDPVTWKQVTPSAQYDLTVDWEMTPGCLYRVTADPTIEDDAGNPMDPDGSVIPFTGFQPDTPAGRFFSHWRQMVPLKNRQEDKSRDLERYSNCIQEIMDLLLYDVDKFTNEFDPDLCSDDTIDLMLYDMGNPFDWAELELTALDRRKLLRILIEIYKSKGTDAGIEQTVLFLLGHTVRVVEYAADGWILGVSELGSSSTPEIFPLLGEGTFAFSAYPQPWEWKFRVDNGTEQTVTFIPDHFADPGDAKAAEIVAVIESQLSGGAAYVTRPGQPAFVSTGPGPFNLSGGEDIQLEVNGIPYEIRFRPGDFAVAGAATPDEVAARIALDCLAVYSAQFPYPPLSDGLYFATKLQGTEASIELISGSALAELSIGPGTYEGADELSFAIRSDDPGPSAAIELTNAADLFPPNNTFPFLVASAAAGGSVLAPSDPFTLYSFDIEYDGALTTEEIAIVRKIAEYMKVAHTHLINIRPVPEFVRPEGWIIGVDELDVSSELMP